MCEAASYITIMVLVQFVSRFITSPLLSLDCRLIGQTANISARVIAAAAEVYTVAIHFLLPWRVFEDDTKIAAKFTFEDTVLVHRWEYAFSLPIYGSRSFQSGNFSQQR